MVQELEAERVKLMEDVTSNKRKMKELEDNLLFRLTSTQVSLHICLSLCCLRKGHMMILHESFGFVISRHWITNKCELIERFNPTSGLGLVGGRRISGCSA